MQGLLLPAGWALWPGCGWAVAEALRGFQLWLGVQGAAHGRGQGKGGSWHAFPTYRAPVEDLPASDDLLVPTRARRTSKEQRPDGFTTMADENSIAAGPCGADNAGTFGQPRKRVAKTRPRG